ncbi:MAG TPA: VWA domain-containing protein [Phycisphaerales bacterium]|nr:VWA domain-containing protein [Phycisphaerales bacterium]
MSFRIEDPVWLWLLTAGIPVALVALIGFTAMARLRRWSAILARVVLIGLLAAALAGASNVRRVDKAALIVAVDTSGSVRAFVPGAAGEAAGDESGLPATLPVLDAVRTRLWAAASRESGSLGPDDTLTIFTFDSAPRALQAPTRLSAPLSTAQHRPFAPTALEGSDLAAAIRSAAASIPPDAQTRILLISDGLAQGVSAGGATNAQTPAAAALAAARAAFAATGTPIDVLPLRFDAPREVIVESLDAPARVASDRAPVPLTLSITSIAQGPVAGTLRLQQEGRPVPLPPEVAALTLQPGRNILTLSVPLSAGRLHRFEATFEPAAPEGGAPPADTVAANNRAVAFTASPGSGRILIVDGTGVGGAAPRTAEPLAATLSQAGISATTLTPTAFDAASDLLSLQAFDLVVLVDVPADALSAASQQSLARYVSDTGGGLLMVGGPPPTANSFGAGGWKGTPIEPILPVTLDLPDRLVMPSTAVVIILDSSGSMAHRVMGSSATQQQIANRGAAAALSALDKQDLVGVVEFSSRASWVVPLHANDDPQRTAEKILAISPDGGTNLPPALELAYQALQPVRAAVKHVIVLSDGQSQGRGRLAAIAQKFKDAPGGPIKITSIAVGDGADTEGLERLARSAGPGGEYFRVVDPNVLPRIFVKAVRVVRTPLVREEPFLPALGPGAAASPATAGITGLPRLGGLILTQPRLDAQKKNVEGVTYALLTPQGEPLLAHWRAGLGQVGAFTSSPIGSGWASEWNTPEARSLWTQLARSLSRSGAGGGSGDGAGQPDLVTRIEGDTLHIRVDAPAASGAAAAGPAPPDVAVYSPSGERRSVPMALTSPGVYEASVPTVVGDQGVAGEGEGVYVVTVAPSAPGAAPVIGGAVKPSAAAAEYRVPSTSSAGADLLTRIARETGGRVLTLDDLNAMTAPQLLMRDKVEPRESRTPLWPILVWSAAGVLLLDIATRRIAWDRWSDRDGGEPASGQPRTASRSRKGPIKEPVAPRPESDSPLAAAKRRARQRTSEA